MNRILALLLISISAIGQIAKIDTIPFSLEKKLLTFKGKINDKETEFAFDTGASRGVACSFNISNAGIKLKNNKTKVTDSNQAKKQISNIIVEDIAIGNFHFKKVKDVSIDMTFLACNNLYLLGQNVIKDLNWKIDFNKKLLYISKAPFEAESNDIKWKIKKYENNRPLIDFKIQNQNYKFLIDLGFSGFADINTKVVPVVNQFEAKFSQGQCNIYTTSTMGLFGFSPPMQTKDFRIDSLEIGGSVVKDMPISISNNTDNKLGTAFFSGFCNQMILNFSDNTIILNPSNKAFSTLKGFDIKLTYVDNKLKVLSKNMNLKNPSKEFEIGEEIMSINGRKANDFQDECDFFNWHFFDQSESILVEKLTGQKVLIKRSKD